MAQSKRNGQLATVLFFVGGAAACSGGASREPKPSDQISETGPVEDRLANVTAAMATGEPGNYTFAVSIRSPDTGCDLYANWWEVLSADGELLYRRVLAHSHVDEQPFARSGGPVDAAANDRLVVRAHLHNAGSVDRGSYGGIEFVGSVASGFVAADDLGAAAAGIESADPQPTGCAF